jgi:hypothetical protein
VLLLPRTAHPPLDTGGDTGHQGNQSRDQPPEVDDEAQDHVLGADEKAPMIASMVKHKTASASTPTGSVSEVLRGDHEDVGFCRSRTAESAAARSRSSRPSPFSTSTSCHRIELDGESTDEHLGAACQD